MKNDILVHLLFRRSFFGPYFRIMSNPSQKAIYSSRNKSQMAPNEKVFFMKNWGWDHKYRVKVHFYNQSPVFEERMKERGSMYEHFPLCGSAWGAIWGRLLKKQFSNNNCFSENSTFLDGGFGRFQKDFYKFVIILAWSRDGKWREGHN